MRSLDVVFSGPQRAEVVENDVPTPEPDQVLCRADLSMISIGTELSCYRGEFDPGTNWQAWVKYPFFPGYSMSATIVEAGSRVTSLAPGDRVAVWTPHRQYFTFRPDPGRAKASDGDTAQPDFLPWRKIPSALRPKEAVWACLANTTQLGVRRADLRLGERAVVVGLGQLGQLTVQWLRVGGCRTIMAVDQVASRLETAVAHGATHAFLGPIEQAERAVAEACGEAGADVVFDITGHPAVLAHCVQRVRRLGRVVLVGDTPTPARQNIGPCVVSRSVAVLGVHATAFPTEANEWNPWTADAMVELFFDMLLQKRMSVADLPSHRVSPLEAPRVYADLFADRTRYLGVIFDWTKL